METNVGKDIKNITWKEKVMYEFKSELSDFWIQEQKFKDVIDLLPDVFWNDVFKVLYNFNNWISNLKDKNGNKQGKKPKNFLVAYMNDYFEYLNTCDLLDEMKEKNDIWDYWYKYMDDDSGSVIWKKTRSFYGLCHTFNLTYCLACVLPNQDISFFKDILKGLGKRCNKDGVELDESDLKTPDHFNRPQMKIKEHYEKYFNGNEKRMTLPEWIMFCIECCKVVKTTSKENSEARTVKGSKFNSNYKDSSFLKNQNGNIIPLKETI